jgi:hypothetical protein
MQPMSQVGQCPRESHKLRRRVRLPDLQLVALREFARRMAGNATAGHGAGYATAGHGAGYATAGHGAGYATAGHGAGYATAGHEGRVRKPEKRRGREPREFVGSTPTSVNWKGLFPGLLVQRKDTWPATRKSGFDSPAVHSKNKTEGSRIRFAGLLC